MNQVAEAEGRRFAFGENWSRFAMELPSARIDAARVSIAEMLGRESLEGVSFLDIGSGSGLFSLAAATMGADPIHSLDFDPSSVATTEQLRSKFGEHRDWVVERADVLDRDHMESLGEWDIVYSWGVLHHTGDMWRALDHAAARVRAGGWLFISIYNDQGWRSRVWARVKRIYNSLPGPLRKPYAVLVMLPRELRSLASMAVNGGLSDYVREWTHPGEYGRGMSRWHDLVDWVGGYPFEVASPNEINEFLACRGFELRRIELVSGLGCNEFVFERSSLAILP
jgi:2-polyprenyl-3-methyl-5-hydroxy-6-metoxy-1,4-benzoquinol methylase